MLITSCNLIYKAEVTIDDQMYAPTVVVDGQTQ